MDSYEEGGILSVCILYFVHVSLCLCVIYSVIYSVVSLDSFLNMSLVYTFTD